MIVRIIYRYFPHRLQNTVPIYDSYYDDHGVEEYDWSDFLQSDSLRQVKESYLVECKNHGSFECPEGISSLLDLWIATLNRACAHYDIYLNGSNLYNKQKRREVWNTVCFLLKGVFYLANDIPLQTMKTQRPEEYLLHAAVAALPLCCQILKTKTKSNKHLLRVFLSVFNLESSWTNGQLEQPGPVLSRFPLHIAAANHCTNLDTPEAGSGVPSKMLQPSISKSLEVEIFDKIVKASPSNAASTKDSLGNYPLDLACKSGYSWLRGLKDLFHKAPEVAHPHIFVLMAQAIQTKANDGGVSCKPKRKRKKKNLNQSSRNALQKLISKFRFISSKKGSKDSDENLGQLNTVYQLFQADPMIVLSFLS